LKKNSNRPEIIVVDTSSLIALERINLLEILCQLYKEVLVPDSVIKEFGNISLPCLSIRKIESNLLKLLITDLNLGKGEAEVIALANQKGLTVVIDDSKARKVAENMGLKLTGTIGVLMRAEKEGLIVSAPDKVKELKEKGFYVSEELFENLQRFK
jgi:predicted nucleic acid-binding protein